MSTKTKAPLSFTALPRDYPALCRLHLPRPIRDQADYDNTVEIADAFAGFEDAMSTDQTDFFDLLCKLIEVYEEEHVKWPKKRTALQRLQYLLAEHNLNGADLTRILGASRNLGNAILRGEREITADHARALGKHFALPAGAFIE